MIEASDIDDIMEDLEFCKVKDIKMAIALIKNLYVTGKLERSVYERAEKLADGMIADIYKKEKDVGKVKFTIPADNVKHQKR